MQDYAWFGMALAGPFLYALTNHIDKQLLNKYLVTHKDDDGVASLLIVSALFSLVVIPLAGWMDPSVFGVSISNVLILAVVGLLNVGIVWFYLKALKVTDTSSTVIFYQLVPVLGVLLGRVFLGESIGAQQSFAMVVIIIGTTVVAFELDGNKRLLLRRTTVVNMLLACLCWALQAVIFKMVAIEENVWRSLFWEHIMMFLVGLLLLANPVYRKHFRYTIQKNSAKILALNGTNELLYLSGSLVVAFAYLKKEASLVLLGNSYQPIFVLLIAIVLWSFFPKVAAERVTMRKVLQNVIALSVTMFGTYLLITA